MQQVLKTVGLTPEELNAANQSLNQSLSSQTNVMLNLANAIWFQEGIQLKPGSSPPTAGFPGRTGPVDFKKPESARTINDWADSRREGKSRTSSNGRSIP